MKSLLSIAILALLAVTPASGAEDKNRNNSAEKSNSDSSESETQRITAIEQSLETLIKTVFNQKSIKEQPSQPAEIVNKTDKAKVLEKRLEAIQTSMANISKASSSLKASASDTNLVWVKTCCCVSCDQTGCGSSGTDCCHQYCCGYCYSQIKGTAD